MPQHTAGMRRASRASWQNFESTIDTRRKWGSLAQAAEKVLPDHMVLLTPTPRQTVKDGIVKRVFLLGFKCGDGRMLTHMEEHNDHVHDEPQLTFARDTFQSHLKAAQLV